MQIKYFIILIALIILAAVVDLIRREKMTFKYAVNWFMGCGIALFFAFNDPLLVTLSRWAGFSLPSNFIFFALLVFVIFLSLHLTIYINEQNSRTESMAQVIAQLQHQLKKIQENNTKSK